MQARVRRPRLACGAVTGLALTLCQVLAATSQESAAPGSAPGNLRPREEVEIIGERPQWQLREEMQAAELRAYELFNSFNDEPRFEITCYQHEPTGTRIARQICQPAFERDATSDHGRVAYETYQAFLDPYTPENSVQSSHQPLEAVIASQREAYRSKMREVASEHPEFLEAIMEYARLRANYEGVPIELPDTVPPTVQERARTSPEFYSP